MSLALPASSGIELRPYQTECLAAIRAARGRGLRRVLVTLPTGTGKTIIFSALAHETPGRVLVLAHREELLEQARDKLLMGDPSADVGIVQAERDETATRIVVASIQTVVNPVRLDRLGAFDLVIVDEAHHAAAESYVRTLERLGAWSPGGPFVLGVTATAERGDKAALGSIFQDLVYELPLLQAMSDGYLCDLRAVQVRLETDFGSVRTHHGDFADADLADELLAADAPGQVAEAWIEHAAGRKGILFAPTIASAEAFASALQDAGVAAESLSGETPKDERKAILARLRTGETRLVANCGVLVEGFDEGSIDAIVMARPTRSRPLYVQCVGRGTRKYPGKSDCLILDVAGTATRHSLISAGSLAGLSSDELRRGGGSIMRALEARQREQEQRDPWEGDPWAAQAAQVAHSVNLFRQRPMAWTKAGEVFVLPIQNGRILVRPAGGERWAVVEQSYGAGLRQLYASLPLEYAMGAAEDRVRQLGAAHLADPRAPWRSEPATARQEETLMRWRKWQPGLTKGQASDLISAGKRR